MLSRSRFRRLVLLGLVYPEYNGQQRTCSYVYPSLKHHICNICKTVALWKNVGAQLFHLLAADRKQSWLYPRGWDCQTLRRQQRSVSEPFEFVSKNWL